MSDANYEGIIVLGSPRSGTTLMRRILNAHPDIACPGETNLFSACARFLHSETIAEGVDISVLSGLDFAGFDESYVLGSLREYAFGFHREHAKRQGKKRWASKTAFDIFYLDQIEKLFGDHAYFICIQRHGLDVACSLKDLCDTNGGYLSEVHEYIKQYPQPLQAFCHLWVDVNRAMQTFVERHPKNVLLIKYEDLTADPKAVTAKIAEFVKVEWTADWVDRSMQTSSNVGLGDWKTYGKTKVDTEGVGRWRTLSEYTISMMGRICNPMLEASGYPAVPIKKERTAKEARRRYELGLRIRTDLAKNTREK
ncbi:MAG: sulfotransferase [Verrucomicrobia bacterium]|nr:sulfotransferase [Verrucomicrobiota bacterium]